MGQRGGGGDLVRLVETYDVLVLERVQHLCEGQRRGGVGERAGGRRAPLARGGTHTPGPWGWRVLWCGIYRTLASWTRSPPGARRAAYPVSSPRRTRRCSAGAPASPWRSGLGRSSLLSARVGEAEAFARTIRCAQRGRVARRGWRASYSTQNFRSFSSACGASVPCELSAAAMAAGNFFRGRAAREARDGGENVARCKFSAHFGKFAVKRALLGARCVRADAVEAAGEAGPVESAARVHPRVGRARGARLQRRREGAAPHARAPPRPRCYYLTIRAADRTAAARSCLTGS